LVGFSVEPAGRQRIGTVATVFLGSPTLYIEVGHRRQFVWLTSVEGVSVERRTAGIPGFAIVLGSSLPSVPKGIRRQHRIMVVERMPGERFSADLAPLELCSVRFLCLRKLFFYF
jgi:hypothetical protein